MWEIILGAIIGLALAGLSGAIACALTAFLTGFISQRKIVVKA